MPLTETELLPEILKDLALMPPSEFPFVTAYVDLSPELDAGSRGYTGPNKEAYRSSGQQNAPRERGPVRPGIRDMHDRLRQRDGLFEMRGSDRESFDVDKKRIAEYLESDSFDQGASGIAIFACAGIGYWQTVEVAVRMPTRLYISETPLLYPLAQTMEDYERFAFVVAKTDVSMIYVVALGRTEIEERVLGPKVNRTMQGGVSQKRYQTRVDNAMSNHVKDTAERLEQLVAEEDIAYIVISGDVTTRTNFQNHLRPDTLAKVVLMEASAALTPRDIAIADAMNAVIIAEQDDARDLARQARDFALSENLGTFGEEPVRFALSRGAVHVLLIDNDFQNTTMREEFTEAAIATGAQLEFVEGSTDLRRMHGIAAILRYRPEGLPNHPRIFETAMEEDAAEATARNRANETEEDRQNNA